MVYSGTDQRKHQRSASLAFVRGIHRWPVNSLHKGPVMGKMFPFDYIEQTVFWRCHISKRCFSTLHWHVWYISTLPYQDVFKTLRGLSDSDDIKCWFSWILLWLCKFSTSSYHSTPGQLLVPSLTYLPLWLLYCTVFHCISHRIIIRPTVTCTPSHLWVPSLTYLPWWLLYCTVYHCISHRIIRPTVTSNSIMRFLPRISVIAI